MLSNLPPIDFSDEIKKFDAYHESKKVKMNKCNHIGKAKLVNGEIRCVCGAGWSGGNIAALAKALKIIK